MKDITISGKAVKREVWILLGCLVFAECLNVFAIVKYSRPAVELVSMIGYVIVTAIMTYVALLIIRLIIALIIRGIGKIAK